LPSPIGFCPRPVHPERPTSLFRDRTSAPCPSCTPPRTGKNIAHVLAVSRADPCGRPSSNQLRGSPGWSSRFAVHRHKPCRFCSRAPQSTPARDVTSHATLRVLSSTFIRAQGSCRDPRALPCPDGVHHTAILCLFFLPHQVPSSSSGGNRVQGTGSSVHTTGKYSKIVLRKSQVSIHAVLASCLFGQGRLAKDRRDNRSPSGHSRAGEATGCASQKLHHPSPKLRPSVVYGSFFVGGT